MNTGQILADTFAVVKERFGTLLGLWALFLGLTIALFLVLGLAVGATGLAGLASMSEGNGLGAGVGMIVGVIVFYLAYLLLTLAQYGSMISAASPLGRPGFGEALATGWRIAPALFLLLLVLAVAYVIGAIAFSVVGAAFGLLGNWARTLPLIVLIPAIVWVGCRLAPVYAVVAVDGVRNPITVITRSWGMTRGHVLTILLASLAFIVFLVIVGAVLLLPSFGLLRSMADPQALAAGPPALGGLALMGLGFLVFGILFNITYAAFLAVIHASLSTAQGGGAAEAFI